MYQTLYRKYRPKKFGEIVGQDVIVQTLSNSISNHKISHAYLFVGPRGTGKTSTAKVFARAVNCLESVDGDLCGKCKNCQSSFDQDCLDIIEIDAASNNGVDEIRNLREKVNLVPSELKYKVYIIDEVHMLTISAFNALLKTLEEPPDHVIFILATTDPQKVPETILSRCQCFNFSRIANGNIVAYLTTVCQKENIKCDINVLENIALISDGGMRDSLGMLDQLSAYQSDQIVLEDFLTLNGLITNQDLEQFLVLILENNVTSIIDILNNWNLKGKNLIQIMIQFLNYLKDRLIDCYLDQDNSADLSLLQQLANLINEKMFDIKKCSNPKIYIEIMLLNFIYTHQIISREIISNLQVTQKDEQVIDISQNTEIKKKKEKGAPDDILSNKKNESRFSEEKIVRSSTDDLLLNSSSNDVFHSNIKEVIKIRMNNAFISAKKEYLIHDKNAFHKLNDYTFDQEIGYLVCALLDGNLRLSSENYLVLSYEYDSVVMENLANLEEMEKVIDELLQIKKKIVIISNDHWNNYAKEYVEHIKNKIDYEYIEEPKLLFENIKNEKKVENNEDKDSASTIFGDIVEVC